LPLTCSFASKVYETVYKDLLAMSGIRREKIEAHSDVFENLLGFFYGRMYYNMNNWYRMAEFAPGYRRNKQNFERMITSNSSQKMTARIRPHALFVLVYPLIIAFKVATFGHVCRRFDAQVKKHLRDLHDRDFDALDYPACITLFKRFNEDLLRRWYVTVENDFFVMTYLGILGKMLDEEELQRAIVFPSKATEQVHTLAALSRHMAVVPEVWSAVASEDTKAFDRALELNPGIRNMLNDYLHTFGGRFASELKLEAVGVDEDMTRLFALLKTYRTYAEEETRTPQLRPQRITVRLVLAAFKRHASRREEFRLLRSNTFAMARRLFKRMGALLAEHGTLARADDVFYLTLEELMQPSAPQDDTLRALVEKRKAEYASYREVTLPAHFTTRDGKPPVIQARSGAPRGAGALRGRPASPGIVSGKVRVFKEFSMPSEIDFDILVTAHTDPGWTSLIALSKGLIIEHGGVLSHASIVARELGIPAVIGMEDAMNILSDGQKVEMNGSMGTVTLL
jgi:pyruvate,water dikinase